MKKKKKKKKTIPREHRSYSKLHENKTTYLNIWMSGNFPNIWSLNKIILNNPQVKSDPGKYFKLKESENTQIKNSGCSC